ncbi:MAG TPA: D-2-hydroxyacid dehydrogenase [Nocardioidaceae bacterium]|nr:D-2-hydroxyacid dehydrogenase [Nocardioidaceae bacterium]
MAPDDDGRDDSRPVVVVLCPQDAQRPELADLGTSMDVRYTDEAGLADAVSDAEVLFLWDFFSTAVQRVWSRAASLQWIHVAAAGVDKLLFDELVTSPVTVTNARGVFDRPMAEFVLMSILAHAKQAGASQDLQRAHRWLHRDTATVQGARALVVGTGAIGRETARLLAAVGMEVRGAGRTARAGDPDFGDVIASSDLAAHAGWADYLVVAAPLTSQTRGMIDAEVLHAMKPTGYLVNVGRGESVREPDLLEALGSGEIAGAALDVFATEPLPQDHPLWDAPGVRISAHMSGDAEGWHGALSRQFVDNAHRYLEGRPLLNVVDKRLGFVPADRASA